MQAIQIQGDIRNTAGKSAARGLRRQGQIPCELYGIEGGNIHFVVTPKSVKGLVYTPDFHQVDLVIEGKTHRAILKSIDFDPISDEIIHMDFLSLVPGRKVKVEVPVRFSGVSPGVKAGGKLAQKVHKVKIKSTPEDLVELVTLDVSNLGLGQSIRVRDIKVGPGVEVLNSPGIPLATIEIPRALKSAGAKASAIAQVEEDEAGGDSAGGGEETTE